ncbi:MAG: hypothetical protein SPL41_01875, partial [Succinivibrionaceae bacterium]|nr:hypothetical protein [Succinivibrionaceae bacterium]
MSLFNLPEPESRISQPDIRAVIFGRIRKILFPFYVVPYSLGKKKGIPKIPEVAADCLRINIKIP